MKIALSKEQRFFFEQNGFLELEELMMATQIVALKQEIQLTLQQKKLPHSHHLILAEQQFQVGRDLWRESKVCHKWSLNQNFAEIASELTHKDTIRIGYTQYMPALQRTHFLSDNSAYNNLLQRNCSLKEISSIKDILLGLLICLDDRSNTSEELPPVFANKAGNGVFFSPELLINFSLLEKLSQSYLLIAYTELSAVYFLNREDPLVSFWKSLGYAYGDRLSDKLNPIVYRS